MPDLLAVDLVVGGLETGSHGHLCRREVIGVDVGDEVVHVSAVKPADTVPTGLESARRRTIQLRHTSSRRGEPAVSLA
jgi:hypothetical protein